MGKIPQARDLPGQIADLKRRIELRERAPLINTFPLISSINSAVQNQPLPPSGNFDGSTYYDAQMVNGLTCVFTLARPTPIVWFSYATLAVGGASGSYAFLVTSVSLAPWNSSQWIFRSGSQVFDKRNTGYLQSEHHFVISSAQTQGAIGPGAAALGITSNQGPLPPGTYEVRQQMWGDLGISAQFYQGNIEVFAPGG